MNYRKFAFRTIAGCILGILANLAFAPIFQAGAMDFGASHAPTGKTLASNDKTPPQNSDAARTGRRSPNAGQPQPAAVPGQSGAQPAPAEQQPPRKNDSFDGYTTFAMNESRAHPSFDSTPWLLGSVDVGTATNPTTNMGRTLRPPVSSDGEPTDPTSTSPQSDHDSPSNSHVSPQDDYACQACTDEDVPAADSKPVASVPEPSTLALLLAGITMLIVTRRRM